MASHLFPATLASLADLRKPPSLLTPLWETGSQGRSRCRLFVSPQDI